MTVTVVVPTRDRPASLRRCLAALARQDARELDVVVVDDGSRDRGAVEEALGSLPGARLLRTPGRGPAVARNLGARAAEGEVVCFTDDDCEPEPGWARLLAEAVAAGDIAAGRTVPPADAGPAVIASQTITNALMLASLDRATGRLGFAPTCNLAASREATRALPFDESYPTAAGEDRDWFARALESGVAPAYVPGAVVTHRQRLDPSAFLRQQLRYGRGAARFRAERRAGEGGTRAGRPQLARPGFYLSLVRRGFADGARVGALVLAAQAATAIGVAAERLSRPSR